VGDVVVEDLVLPMALTAMNSTRVGFNTPGALFARSDTIAIGGRSRARMRPEPEWHVVPGDCSVIGYDDSPAALYHNAGADTIRQDTRWRSAARGWRPDEKILGWRNAPAVALPTELHPARQLRKRLTPFCNDVRIHIAATEPVSPKRFGDEEIGR